jgi:hypothetical protein
LEGVKNPHKRAYLNAFCFLNSRNSKPLKSGNKVGGERREEGGGFGGGEGWEDALRLSLINKRERIKK